MQFNPNSVQAGWFPGTARFMPIRVRLTRRRVVRIVRLEAAFGLLRVTEVLFGLAAAALLAGAVLLAFADKILRSWYLREVRRAEVVEDPAEAIVTYPLA